MTPQQLDRFWARVEKTETCWIWLGAINKYGYGAVGINGKVLRAHRISWAIANGRTPTPKEFVCHSCDNRPCVNPGHLWLGDNRSNMADCVAKGRNSKPPHKEKSKNTVSAGTRWSPVTSINTGQSIGNVKRAISQGASPAI